MSVSIESLMSKRFKRRLREILIEPHNRRNQRLRYFKIEYGCKICGHKFMDEITAWVSPSCPNCGSVWTGPVVRFKIKKRKKPAWWPKSILHKGEG